MALKLWEILLTILLIIIVGPIVLFIIFIILSMALGFILVYPEAAVMISIIIFVIAYIRHDQQQVEKNKK